MKLSFRKHLVPRLKLHASYFGGPYSITLTFYCNNNTEILNRCKYHVLMYSGLMEEHRLQLRLQYSLINRSLVLEEQ